MGQRYTTPVIPTAEKYPELQAVFDSDPNTPPQYDFAELLPVSNAEKGFRGLIERKIEALEKLENRADSGQITPDEVKEVQRKIAYLTGEIRALTAYKDHAEAIKTRFVEAATMATEWYNKARSYWKFLFLVGDLIQKHEIKN